MEEFPLEHIVKQCLNQDRTAQEKLYHYTYEKLIGTAMRYGNSLDEAKWVFNLAMMKVFKSIGNYKLGTNFLGFANDILIKTCIDNIRSNNKHQKIMAPVDSTIVESNKIALNDALDKLETEKIFELIQSLPDNQRMIFSMYEIEGYKHREIEEMTGININTSKWMLAKAKKELKEKLNNMYGLKMMQ